MREGIERRHTEEDLELGRQHMMEILERVIPLVNMDPEKNDQYHQLIKDLKSVNRSIDLKQIYQETRRRLSDLDIGGTGGLSPENREEVHKLILKLNSLPIDLFRE